MLNHADYVLGAGADTRVAWGALLELILVIANIATAVLFPVLKRQNESVSLGFVAARIVESAFIAVGIIAVLALVTLRQDVAGVVGLGAVSVALGKTLVAVHDWTFLLGPGFIVGLGNGLLLGYLMYRSGLVPRGMALLGLIGGPLLMASAIPVLFGVYEAGSAAQVIATIPEFLWEASLGIYLTFWGFRAAGLRKLGFEPVVPASTTATKSELRPAA